MNRFEILDWKYDREFLKNLPESYIPVGEEQVDGDYSDLIGLAVFFASQFGLGGCRSFTEYVRMISEEDPVLLDAIQFKMSMMNKIKYAEDKELKDLGQPNPQTTFREDLEELLPEYKVDEESQVIKEKVSKFGVTHEFVKEDKPSPETEGVMQKASQQNPNVIENVPEPITKDEWEEHYKDGWTKKYESTLGANDGESDKIENFLMSNNCSKKDIKEFREKVDKGQIIIPKHNFNGLNKNNLAKMSPEEFQAYLDKMNEYQQAGKNFRVEIGDFGKSKE